MFSILFWSHVRLKNEVGIMLEQIKKHNAAKETLKAMNEAYKRQVDLVKEECGGGADEAAGSGAGATAESAPSALPRLFIGGLVRCCVLLCPRAVVGLAVG